MRLLLDTHVLLWAAGAPERIPERWRLRLENGSNELAFSSASIWEVVIKLGLGRKDFRVDPERLRRRLVGHGYVEVPVTSDHALGVSALPALHSDPFDRILVAQARVEGFGLLTADRKLLQYGEPVLDLFGC
ncbi:type II toxin-antitoxin system VapC family toxin [Deferrisoma palaeochoriense]